MWEGLSNKIGFQHFHGPLRTLVDAFDRFIVILFLHSQGNDQIIVLGGYDSGVCEAKLLIFEKQAIWHYLLGATALSSYLHRLIPHIQLT